MIPLMQTDKPSAQRTPFLTAHAFEAVDPELLGMDPATWVPSESVNFCRAVLGTLALRPEEVTLVVAGDMVKSVRDRLPEGVDRDAFNDERGAGMLAGKTMQVGDAVYVLLPYWFFVDSAAALRVLGDEDADDFVAAEETRFRLARRTVIHEAQHVVMFQAGEGAIDFSGAARARRDFVALAHFIVDEYRAELGVPTEVRETFETEVESTTLPNLQSNLSRIVNEYQLHLDPERLMYSVLPEAQHAWKALACVAAARRVAGSTDPLDSDTDGWVLMASTFWDRFENLLTQVPSAHTRITQSELKRLAEELADILDDWLRGLGFTWRDIDNGSNAEFRITSWRIVG